MQRDVGIDVAKLVDEGRFSWNDKVTKVYPSFRLGERCDHGIGGMRHLVCACTGLPRRDFPTFYRERP